MYFIVYESKTILAMCGIRTMNKIDLHDSVSVLWTSNSGSFVVLQNIWVTDYVLVLFRCFHILPVYLFWNIFIEKSKLHIISASNIICVKIDIKSKIQKLILTLSQTFSMKFCVHSIWKIMILILICHQIN